MWLKSEGFAEGETLPRRFTCDGEDLSPPLAWGDLPPGTRSLAILCDDPDAPGGVFHHWTAYDIPVSVSALLEGAAADRRMAQGVNDFRAKGYKGPCPPRGHGPHRYRFRLLALSHETLGLTGAPSCPAVERAARAVLLGEAVLTGVYGR